MTGRQSAILRRQKAAAHVLSKKLNLKAMEYGQLSELAVVSLKHEALNLGCCRIRTATLGKLFRFVVNGFILISQFGVMVVYIAFVATCLQHIVTNTPYIEYELDLRIWIAIVLLPITLMVYIRDLRTMGPLIGVGNVCAYFVLAVILFDSVYRIVNGHAAMNCGSMLPNSTLHQLYPPVCGVGKWPLSAKDFFIFLGIAVFSFEGITVILPVENKLTKPQYFQPVLIFALAMIVVTLVSLPLMAYLAYGKCSNPNVTLDLSSDNVWLQALYLIVLLYLVFAILTTFYMQFYAAADMIEPPILLKLGLLNTEGSSKKEFLKWLTQISIRTVMVLLAGGVSLISPHQLGDYISLVGAVALVSLMFVFPSFIHLLVFARSDESPQDHIVDLSALGSVQDKSELDNSDGKMCRDTLNVGDGLKRLLKSAYKMLWVTKDVLIMVCGVLGAGAATYSSLEELVSHYGEVSPSIECVKRL